MMLGYLSILGTINTFNKTTQDLNMTGKSFYQTTEQNGKNDKYNKDTKLISGASGKLSKHVKCFICDNMGHYANDCPGKQVTSNSNKHNSKCLIKVLALHSLSTT